MMDRRKNNHCLDCGALIFKSSKRCFSCANKGKRNPFWNGGKPKCKRCGKQLQDYGAKQCLGCFLKYNHPAIGCHRSEEAKNNLRIKRLNERNPNWKGDLVGYNAIHAWVKRKLKKPALCQKCKLKPSYDLANISQEYKRDINDYEWLCRSCHMNSDGRMTMLHSIRKIIT